MISDPNLIVGMEHAEDAGVYKLRDDLAIIQTVDFFTPIVDEPYTFGQIAVTNALSDVYAMGGRPLTAVNIVCFPAKTMDMSILRQILQGGLDKMREAGVLLIGGHSVQDEEPKYGLSVIGVIHPDRVLLNRGSRAGDKLILTKPLGTGIVSTALKGSSGIKGIFKKLLQREASEALVARSTACMTTLNKKAAELMLEMPDIHACTDVTGFGFLGHACEMVEDADVGMLIHASSVPFFPGVKELVEKGIVPGGLERNRQYRSKLIEAAPSCPDWMVDIMFDPQTAGGLLIALPEMQAETLIGRMRSNGIAEATIVGEIISKPKGKIRVLYP